MQALQDLIRKEGMYLGNGILKVDSLLNHQLDPQLMYEMGQEIARQFKDTRPTRILTAEVSGIAPAVMAGLALGVPVVYARKHKPITMRGPIFLETAPSHTKGGETNLMVSADYMLPGERILIIDDFLASGKTLFALCRIVESAKCELVGVSTVIEKVFEGGRERIMHEYNVPVKSLAAITYLDEERIEFLNDEA